MIAVTLEGGAFDQFGHPPPGQLPIWLSAEAEALLRWALTVDADVYRAALGGCNKETEFSPAMAMEWRYPAEEHGSPRRREWWESVKNELHRSNLIAERGWSYWYPTGTAVALIAAMPASEIRRTF